MTSRIEYRPDYNRLFRMIPQIVGNGVHLERKGKSYEAKCRIDGTPHSRGDKLVITYFSQTDSIVFLEQGGEAHALPQWLIKYRGASTFKHALDMLWEFENGYRRELYHVPFVPTPQVEPRYVSEEEWQKENRWSRTDCNLYTWLCTLFPKERVDEAWDKYRMTVDKSGAAVFWKSRIDGNICADKRIVYKSDGHRDKEGKCRAYTKFKKALGYGGGFFGGHLVGDDTIHVTEAEKTAIIGYLYYGGTWVAAGGKNGLNSLISQLGGREFNIYADMDALDEWSRVKQCEKWYEGWDSIEANSDIGDRIVSEIESNRHEAHIE